MRDRLTDVRKPYGAIAAALLLTACGSASSHPAPVSADQARVALDRQTLALDALRCDEGKRPSGLIGAVDELTAIYRKDPHASYKPGTSMRTVLAEAAETVESCSPEVARRLRDVLTYG